MGNLWGYEHNTKARRNQMNMTELKEKARKLVWVKIDGDAYIGIFNDNVVTDAIPCDPDNANYTSIEEWIQWANQHELDNIEMYGKLRYSVTQLDQSCANYLERALLVMEQTKRTMIANMENREFKTAMRK